MGATVRLFVQVNALPHISSAGGIGKCLIAKFTEHDAYPLSIVSQ